MVGMLASTLTSLAALHLVAGSTAPAPRLALSCGADSPTCSADHPVHGNVATATVSFPDPPPRETETEPEAGPPQWVRLDRCDAVDDNTIWVE